MKKEKTTSKKKAPVAVIVIIITVLAFIMCAFGYYAILASTDKIYDGVYLGDIHLGGKSSEQAAEAIAQKYDGQMLNPRLLCEGQSFEIYGSQINLAIDYDATARAAQSYGKSPNLFTKIFNMISAGNSNPRINLVLSCDKDLLQYELNERLSDRIVDVQPYTVEIGDDCLIVTNGKPGRGVSADAVIEKIAKAYTLGKITDEIEIQIADIQPESIDAQQFVKDYNRDPKDAKVETQDDTFNIIPEVIGVRIDADKATQIINSNLNNPSPYTIPAKITHPELTAAQLEAEYTDCIIGTYRTNYSSSSANRKENIRLASANINGKILNPGEVFSFNGVVGPRTAAAGYKIAHVYSGGKVVDGIGGGICQVSSTLYNAVVFADLEIVYRTNHTMPVSYVPLGRDATVSYGTIDFKFKNNKNTPIKLEVIADGTYLTVNVYGRKKYLKDISIETAVTGTRAFSVKEIEDDTMYEDERVVEESGSNGTVTESYKIVKENGAVVSRTFLAKSSYTPTTQVVRVGTKKRISAETQAPPADNPVALPPQTETVPDEPSASVDAPVAEDPIAQSSLSDAPADTSHINQEQ